MQCVVVAIDAVVTALYLIYVVFVMCPCFYLPVCCNSKCLSEAQFSKLN